MKTSFPGLTTIKNPPKIAEIIMVSEGLLTPSHKMLSLPI